METERKILRACNNLQDRLGENYFVFSCLLQVFFLPLVLKFLLCPTSGAKRSQPEAGGHRRGKKRE